MKTTPSPEVSATELVDARKGVRADVIELLTEMGTGPDAARSAAFAEIVEAIEQIDCLRLKPKQSRQLTEMADLLNVTPSLFLEWHMDDDLRDLRRPISGMLREWSHGGLMVFESPEEEKMVQARVEAWEAKVIARRKGRKGGKS